MDIKNNSTRWSQQEKIIRLIDESSSDLTDRVLCVSLSNHCSVFAVVHSGVFQVSVLYPILGVS